MGQGWGLRTCIHDEFQDHALRTRDPEQEGKLQENPVGSVFSVEWKCGRGVPATAVSFTRLDSVEDVNLWPWDSGIVFSLPEPAPLRTPLP